MSTYNKIKNNYRKVKTCLSCAYSSYVYKTEDKNIGLVCNLLIDDVEPDSVCRGYNLKEKTESQQ